MPSREIKLSTTLRKPAGLKVVPDDPALLSEWTDERPTTCTRGGATATTRAAASLANVGGYAPALLADALAVCSVVLQCRLPERFLQTADEVGQLGGGDGCQHEERTLGAETGTAAEIGQARVESRRVCCQLCNEWTIVACSTYLASAHSQ